MGDDMDCSAIEFRNEARRPRLTVRLKVIFRAVLRIDRLRNLLDVETMPDYLQRDLGFLDGREPRRERDVPW